MQNEIIFKLFRTRKQPYVYDRHTKLFIELQEDDYEELENVENGKLRAEESVFISKHQQYGLFKPNTVRIIEHPSTMIMEEYSNTRMRRLTLQVTQQCNLRCSYCAYSGDYSNQRTHADRRMTLETAKKAIDFLLERSIELPEVNLAFYGGEPLLEFELIKECVRYAKNNIEGKRLKFNLTTNGTLLTDGVVDFLQKNDFGISISIDGSKAEHDTNRRFINGEGTFDTIIRNINRIRERYPEYDRKISIMTTINPSTDLGCVLEYFSTDEIFSDKSIVFSEVVERNYNGDISYDRNHYRVRNYEYTKMLFALVGKLDYSHVSPLMIGSRSSILLSQRSMTNHSALSPRMHHGGPCMPGLSRAFVRVDGAILPCERVSETQDYFVIGTLSEGLNINKMKAILNIGKLSENDCKNCWCLRHCMICAAQVEFASAPTEEDKKLSCAKCSATCVAKLYELCVLNEFGFRNYS